MSSLKLPKTVKVLHRTFDLVEKKDPTTILENPTYGNNYNISNKIEWLRHEKDSENVDTIVHELLHSLYRVFGLSSKDNEEEVVTRLAIGLTTLMADNKKLFQAFLDVL